MKKRTAKRVLKWIGITLGVLLIIIAAGAAVMFGPFVKADGNAQPGSFGCSTIYTQDKTAPISLAATMTGRNVKP